MTQSKKGSFVPQLIFYVENEKELGTVLGALEFNFANNFGGEDQKTQGALSVYAVTNSAKESIGYRLEIELAMNKGASFLEIKLYSEHKDLVMTAASYVQDFVQRGGKITEGSWCNDTKQ